MNLLYVAPFGLGKKTTIWARTLPLARELVARGHQATIVIPPWDTPKDAGRTWEEDGVTLVNVALGGGVTLTVRRMLAEIERVQPDLVHIIKPRAHAGLVQWLLWRRRFWQRENRPRLILDVDDWEQAWAEINDYGRFTARFLAWQEEWGIRHADGVTAASRWLEDRVGTYAPGTPVLYLPNGVMGEKIGESWTQRREGAEGRKEVDEIGKIRVLFFSRFVEVEPDWLAECWLWLHEGMPNARLIVAGEALTPGREAIFRQAMAEHAPDAAQAVEWRGFVPPDQLAALYREATVAIFPADPVPLQQAKCSVRLATTLLHGAPVVASAVGEQANYGAEGAAALVPPGASPQAFAEATAQLIQRLQAAPSLRTAITTQARERLTRLYNWPRLAAQLEAFYDSIL